jgi:DNA-binding beta-propeller fold protein YncE
VRIRLGRVVVVGIATLALQLGAPLAAAQAAPGDLTFSACLGLLVGCPGVNPTGITDGAAGVAVSPDGRNLYLGAHFGGAVTHFTLDGAGTPTFESCFGNHAGCTVPSGASGALDAARGVAVSPDGKQLYVAAWGGNTVSHFTLDANGKPTFVGCIGNHAGCTATSPADALAGVERVVVSADGKHLYAAASYRTAPAPNGGQDISYFTVDATGAPTYVGCIGAPTGCTHIASYPAAVAGARDIALSADGRNLYVASTLGPGFSDSNTLAHFTLDAAGTPTFERCIGNQTGCTVPSAPDAFFASTSAALSRDGTRLYVGANNGIAYLTIDGAGVPTFAGCIADTTGCTRPAPTGLISAAYGMELAPDGKQLYVAGDGSDVIARFALDANGIPTFASCNGALAGCTPTSPAGAVDGPFDLAVTPDGRRLYAAIYNGALIDRFEIEQAAPPAAPGPPTPTIDVTAPTISGFTLSRRTFAAASKGATFAAAAVKKRPKIGTTVRLRLSEKATLTFRIQKRGRKGRYATLKGSVARAAKQGPNSVKFSGRWRGKPLAPARYRLVTTARDAAGNPSKAKRIAFTIVRRPAA